MRRIFNDEQIKFIKENYDKMSYSEIGDRLGFTERQIRGKVNGMGLSKLRKFDKYFFYSVDTPEKAYWLGFFYADGWVVYNQEKRNYEASIELQQNDDYILKNFIDSIGGTHTLKYSHRVNDVFGKSFEVDTVTLRIYSKQIVSDLIRNGVVERKTYSAIYPEVENYFRDFVRGYFDGNGCIYINHHHSDAPAIHFTSACVPFLEYLRDKISQELNIDGAIYSEYDLKNRLVYFRKKDVISLLKWMYYSNDIPMLYRKYDKSVSLLGLAAS